MKTNLIHPTAIIYPNVVMGTGNRIGAFSVIGGPPEHKNYWSKTYGKVFIGNDNFISNHVTIDAGSFADTVIKDRCILLKGSHVGHDCYIEDNVTISCDVLIGGESYIMQGANLGLGAIIHQRQYVGSWSMIGMGSVVTKNLEIIPANMYAGNPAKYLKPNEIGIKRNELSKDMIKNETQRFYELRNEKS